MSKTDLHKTLEEARRAVESVEVSAGVAKWRAKRVEIFLAVLLILLFLLALGVKFDPDHYFEWDLALSCAVQATPFPGFEALMYWVSIPGNNSLLASGFVTLVGIIFYIFGHKTETYFLALSSGVGHLLNVVMKALIARPRPNTELVTVAVRETSLSFPSGHVMHYVVFYGFLFFLAYTLLRRSLLRSVILTICASLVLLVGLSRVYLGAHWPSDVTAAYIAGGLWLVFVIDRYRKWKERVA